MKFKGFQGESILESKKPAIYRKTGYKKKLATSLLLMVYSVLVAFLGIFRHQTIK